MQISRGIGNQQGNLVIPLKTVSHSETRYKINLIQRLLFSHQTARIKVSFDLANDMIAESCQNQQVQTEFKPPLQWQSIVSLLHFHLYFFCLFKHCLHVETCLFLNKNLNAMNMFALKWSIRLHSSIRFTHKMFSSIMILTLPSILLRQRLEGGWWWWKMQKSLVCMLLSKTLLTMYRHCFKSPNTGDIREWNPR